MSLLPKNPVTMRGRIDRCWLFTYRTPVAEARRLLPAALEPVTHGPWAFWNVVVCHIDSMRPAPFPAWSGVSYWHVAYRLYGRFLRSNGSAIDGLYFLRSDCDSRLLGGVGNLVTDFNFHTARVAVEMRASTLTLRIDSADAPGSAVVNTVRPPTLPEGSAFSDLAEAAAILKYQPRALAAGAGEGVSVVEITRAESAWKAKLVRVESAHWGFFEGHEVHPEICYEVEPITYQWNRGRCIS